MIIYKPRWCLEAGDENPRHYWKVKSDQSCSQELRNELEKAGLLPKLVGDQWREDRILAMHSRYARGMLVLDGCTLHQLQQWYKMRNLPAHRVEGFDKSRMITALEEADENVKLDRFMFLPAELRVEVYRHLFASYELKAGHMLPSPPIARASRLLRKESLPVFYEDSATRLHFWMVFGADNQVAPDFYPTALRFGPPELLGRVSQIRVCAEVPFRYNVRRVHEFTFTITCQRSLVAFTGCGGWAKSSCPAPEFAALKEELDERAEVLRRTFQERTGSSDHLGLVRSDFELLQNLYALTETKEGRDQIFVKT